MLEAAKSDDRIMIELAQQADTGSGRILCLRVTHSTACPSRTSTRELPLATMEPSSGQPMVVTTGLLRPVGLRVFAMASRSRTQTTERLLAREAQFSEQQMAELTGLRRRAGPPVSFGAFLLLTQTTEQPWVAMERSFEQPMEETPGL